MKRVSFLVEFVALLDDDVKPDDVTFNIPVDQVQAQSLESGKVVGKLEAYTTQQDAWEVEKEGVT